jgi:hypothetical protein
MAFTFSGTVESSGGLIAFRGVDGVVLAGIPLAYDTFQDAADGNPAAPCLGMKSVAAYQFFWGVLAGARTISIYCKQTCNQTPRPTMTVLANPAIGVSASVQGTAPSGTGWVTVGPIAVSPSSSGVLTVVLNNWVTGRYMSPQSPCLWDHIVTT